MSTNKAFVDNLQSATPTTPTTAQQVSGQSKQGRFTFVGTYTGVVGAVQVSNDGTNYVSVLAQREDTGATYNGTVGAAQFSIIFNISSWGWFRFLPSVITTGPVQVTSDQGSFALPPGVAPLSVGALTQAITSASANALAVGPAGTTNPALNVDASTGSAVTGLNVVAAASGSGVALAALGGTNESVTIDGKGTGGVKLNSVGGTGAIRLGGAGSGNNATGLTVTPAAAASGLAVAVVSTGTNENLTIDAKGSGTISLNVTGTGNIVLGRAATGVSLAVTAGLTSSGPTGAGIGYATGAGGTVSQLTDRTTTVILNKLSGTITTQATSLAAGASVQFTVTNSTVAAGDVVVAAIQSGPTNTSTSVHVVTVAAGSFKLELRNDHASVADTGAALVNFAVFKSVAA
jgi:hypothetical protein